MTQILVLYETNAVGLPNGSSYVRLLLPFSYPKLTHRFVIRRAVNYRGQPADLVIVERFWRLNVTPEAANALVDDVHRRGARLIYELDDDLLALPGDDVDSRNRRESVQVFLERADGVLVSTPELRERYRGLNSNIRVVPNALDERLLPALGTNLLLQPFPDRPVTLGYMGTPTHDRDLRLLIPALQRLAQEVDVPLRLELIGGAAQTETRQALEALPFPVRFIQQPVVEYPQFLTWFASNVRWDIALAPLEDVSFNHSKSDVKFLDYSAAGAAGVYSRLPAYARSVEHGRTGWLTDNDPASWTEAIRTLIQQPDLRQRIAANARRYLLTERVLAVRIQDWIGAVEAFLG